MPTWWVFVIIAIILLLPFWVYQLSKMVTLGKLRAILEINKNKKEDNNGKEENE